MRKQTYKQTMVEEEEK